MAGEAAGQHIDAGGARHVEPHPQQPLDRALAAEWARQDKVALFIVAVIELCILLAGAVTRTIGLWGLIATAGVVGLEAAALALATTQPRRYVARWRLRLMSVTRVANMVIYPAAVDLLSIMFGQPVRPAAAAAAGAGSTAATGAGWSGAASAGGIAAAAGSVVRAAAMLVVPVSGVHACMLVALYWQLPPWIHAAAQAGSVAALMYRASTVCQQFVAAHPLNGPVAEAAHWLLRQLVSLVCLGSREHLAAAAAEAGPIEKCAAVAWTLEASVGLVLSTLLVWRQQLRAAHKHTIQRRLWWQQQQERQLHGRQLSPQQQQSGPHDIEGVMDPEEELRRSQYMRLCEPVLEAAGAYGTWAVPVGGAALVGYIAALFLRPGAPGQ